MSIRQTHKKTALPLISMTGPTEDYEHFRTIRDMYKYNSNSVCADSHNPTQNSHTL